MGNDAKLKLGVDDLLFRPGPVFDVSKVRIGPTVADLQEQRLRKEAEDELNRILSEPKSRFLLICRSGCMEVGDSNLVRDDPRRCDECGNPYVWSYDQTCQKNKSVKLTHG